jgi:ribonuclease-3
MLRMGKSEEPAGRRRVTTLADAFEAIVAALFLDRGLGPVTKFLRQHLLPRLSPDFSLDAKSELQALVQALDKTLPRYRILKQSGLPHARRFEVEVQVKGQRLGRGKGASRQEAEQGAATHALAHLKENPHILRSTQE